MFAGMTFPFGGIASVGIDRARQFGITPRGRPHAVAGAGRGRGSEPEAASQRSAAPGVGAVVAFAPGAGDAVRLLLAAGRAGAAGLERFADGGQLRGGGLPFRFAVVLAVEVGDAALLAVPPEDLRDDVLAARP